MKRTLRTLAVPVLTAVLLAGCGGASGDSESSSASSTSKSQQSDTGGASDASAPMDDGGDDTLYDEANCSPELWDEVEGICADASTLEPLSVEGAFGFSEGGATYTLGVPHPLPGPVIDGMKGLGFTDAELSAIKVIPVEIDNTEGLQSESLFGATAVSEDGQQHEWLSLSGYLFDTLDEYAEKNDSGLGDPVYDELYEVKEDAIQEVARTAKSTQYLVADDEADLDGKFTYMELEGGELGGSPFPMFPKLP
ncbi:hypothetical protein [Brachybacterium sp. ACRRE]|uniref:hypothetical protein n=1 Tax=Brachybacterium sp. ACRRE TaxID=2918184 RepID=UPI001EF26593|nr:hypothetical protein [Brachybacterium sp. ACRRE]MCG7309258.1 hypothetical protein [Brachybacterium sp. ACRRE]